MGSTESIATKYKLSHWEKIVQERNDSGLAIRIYCEKAGIRESSYYYWLKKLRETACAEYEKAQETSKPERPILTEVKLPAQRALPLADNVPQNQVRVEVPGARITAGCEYPIGRLTELIQAILSAEGSACMEQPCY